MSFICNVYFSVNTFWYLSLLLFWIKSQPDIVYKSLSRIVMERYCRKWGLENRFEREGGWSYRGIIYRRGEGSDFLHTMTFSWERTCWNSPTCANIYAYRKMQYSNFQNKKYLRKFQIENVYLLCMSLLMLVAMILK